MSEFELIKYAKSLGLGIVAVFLYYFFHKNLLRRLIFPKLTRKQTFIILVTTIVLFFLLTFWAIYAWVLVENRKGQFDTNHLVKHTFRVVGVNVSKLQKVIADSTDLDYDGSSDATFTIELGYSGSLRRAFGANNFVYEGGHILVLVNGEARCTVDHLKLEAWPDEPGNPKEVLEEKLNEQIRKFLESDKVEILNTIIRCIRDEIT